MSVSCPQDIWKTQKKLQIHILNIFVDEASAGRGLEGEKLEGEVIKPSEDIPSCVKDEAIDINIIKLFFTKAGFETLQKIHAEAKQREWTCFSCGEPLASAPSVGCESSLNWFHFPCMKLKSTPKCKYWYCKYCKK